MIPNNDSWLPAAGRLGLSLIFIAGGAGKLANVAGTVQYMTAFGVPAASLLVWPTILLELGGGLLLLAGFQARLVALAIIAFTALATVLFHGFWAMPAEQVMVNQIMFFKNLGLIGGLAYVVAYGPGRWSVDSRRA